MYRGRWQLATKDAVYSDGDQYTPILTAYKALQDQLSTIENVLVLGCGLGSAVQIMAKKGYAPVFTLVDSDELVLQWAKELLPPYPGEVNLVAADARVYLHTDAEKYDLLIVDIFKGRVIPDFVTTEDFMKNCRLHINTGGSFVLNYIVNEEKEWAAFQQIFKSVFPQYKMLKNGVNRILVATV